MEKPELISPAGDWISLRSAIGAGADAVYFAVKELNMRINAKNFQLSELTKIAAFCHKNNVKAYLALNTIAYDDELSRVKKILTKAKQANIDAIIASDFSVIDEAQKLNLAVHISTQLSISNIQSLLFLLKRIKNVKKVVLARELSLEQIKSIIKKIKDKKITTQIEVFVHGAMCVSISGRCFLSQFLFNKSANRGDCLQPCRRGYIVKDPEEGHELLLKNNFVMSPKDLCTIGFIDKLIAAGIGSFKIEGRNRSPEYVKVVTGCYRKAIDAYFEKKLDKKLKKVLIEKLKTVYNRGFSSGFYLGKPIDSWTDVYGSKAKKKKVYVGYVKNFYRKINVAEIKIQSHDLRLKDHIMFQGKTTGIVENDISSMEFNHKQITYAKKGMNVAVKIDSTVRKNDKVYVVI